MISKFIINRNHKICEIKMQNEIRDQRQREIDERRLSSIKNNGNYGNAQALSRPESELLLSVVAKHSSKILEIHNAATNNKLHTYSVNHCRQAYNPSGRPNSVMQTGSLRFCKTSTESATYNR